MSNPDQIIRISYDQMKSEFTRILIKSGFSDLKAEKCAEIFATNSLEGVYSHGANRFPRFARNVLDGYVVPDAEPTLVHGTGSLEQWNGNLGPGPLNAVFGTERATDLAEILSTRRALSIGYWKGSGFSLLLDILATILSGGQSTHEITGSRVEYSVSQVFIAINPKRLHNNSSIENSIHQIINDLQSSISENENVKIRYPGENIVKTRDLNLKSGIPVNPELWKEIQSL